MTIRIASRSSKLALKQVEIFSKAFLLEDYKLVEVLTSGDKMSAKGEVMFDKANFVNEIEQMIQKNSVDIAIHSAKDMPAQETEGLKHFYFIETQKRKINDLIIFRNDTDTVFEKNMKLGTSSLRRIMQAKFHMNAKNIQLLNGNIDTRIKKLNDGMYDCIILAEAGLSRLSSLLEKQNYKQLEHITCSGQGVLAVQWKEGSKVGDFIKSSLLFDQMKELNEQIKMERNLLKKLNADCNSAISIFASNGFLQGEIFGRDKFITFSGNNVDQLYKDITANNGLNLLNEHH
ncbi:MAG: hydroxymethylbilane synthase [SAR86 cluster bacterium SAR86A]|uniref:Hydroxymethylbilane synthase n=1 Tax=SAR86 cluster bacterium SAR86A TaxID=1123866 RepID=J4KRT3_9GAMM|nr:MAG: hydroxymethylbilane synthase [SAR86 cluster bacterium SAR86A]